MAKKKTALTQTLFRDIDPYGQDKKAEAEGTGFLLLPLEAIHPDPHQPRRLLPGALAQQVKAATLTPQAALQEWIASAKAGDLRLRDLRNLANSIALHGLINPITVRQAAVNERPLPTVRYFIVTGERRFWAHLLLSLENRVIQVGDQTQPSSRIRATEAPTGIKIRAHQLVENIMREDINAVEKAQGLWALRYELSEVNYRSPNYISKPEVNDSSPAKTLVTWDEVSRALNFSKRYRIYLTNVLNLCEEAQALVMTHDLAEMTIRPIVQKLKDRPDLQVQALQQLITWQQEYGEEGGDTRAITKSVKELVDRLLKQGLKVKRAARSTAVEQHTRQLHRHIRGPVRLLTQLKAKDRAMVARDLALDATNKETLAALEQLHQQLDELLAQVDAYRQDS